MKLYKRGHRWWVDEKVNGQRVRYSLGAKATTKAEALALLGKIEDSSSQKTLTVDEYLREYLKNSRGRIATSTLKRYATTFRIFRLALGDRDLGTITSQDISAWALSRLDSGVKAVSINVDLRQLKVVFRHAFDAELIRKVPKFEMLKVPQLLPRHLTEDQFQKILNFCHDQTMKRLFTFLFWTGARRSEALFLDWQNVRLGDRPCALLRGKGDRERMIPLLPPALLAMGEPKGTGLVFPIKPDTATRAFSRLAKSAGFQARLHDLRHSCLTMLVGSGVPLKLVQDIAGHSNIQVTMNYAKIFPYDSYDAVFNALSTKNAQF